MANLFEKDSCGRIALKGIGPSAVVWCALVLFVIAAKGAEPLIEKTWLDGIWCSHLTARAADLPDNALLREAFYRDVLRVNPAHTNALLALRKLHQANDEPVMERMVHGYVTFLASGWNEDVSLGSHTETQQRSSAFSNDYMRAVGLYEKGELVRSELMIRELLNDYPASALLLELYGKVAWASEEWALLAMINGYYASLCGEHAAVLNNYAVALDRVGRSGGALQVVKAGLRRNPNSPPLLAQVVRLHNQSGRPEQAEVYLRKWQSSAPEDVSVAIALARQLALRGGMEKEQQDLLIPFVQTHPDHEELLYLIARSYAEGGEPVLAAEWLERLEKAATPEAYALILDQDVFKTLGVTSSAREGE